MRPPLILHVVLSLNPGGAERLVIELCRETQPRFRVAVCCLDEPGTWADQLRRAGIEVISLARRAGFHVGLARRLAHVSRTCRASILHCHQYTPFVYGVLASRLCRAAVIYTEHGRLSDAKPAVKRQLANRALRLLPFQGFAVSNELREELVRAGLPASRMRVIYNGVSVTARRHLISKHVARARVGIPDDAFVIGTVARLDPVKDLDTLIEGVHRSRVPAHVAIVGEGAERARLERRAATLSVPTTFTGHMADARAVIPAFDLFANTSLTEGVSVTILEAMDACVPIVATRVGGTVEVLEHGQTAYLVQSRSPDAVAVAIQHLVSDAECRTHLAARARSVLEARFSVASMASSYTSAYEEALAASPRTPESQERRSDA